MWLIEGRDERFVNEVGEQNSLWYRVGVQRNRLRCRKGPSLNGYLRRRGRLCFYNIGLREFSELMTRTRTAGETNPPLVTCNARPSRVKLTIAPDSGRP